MTETKLNAKSIGTTDATITEIQEFLNETRTKTASHFLDKWLVIGDLCARIKTAKFEGKFSDNVTEILGVELSNDERQYSMKLHENKDSVLKWYEDKGCMKYNPRTIWTAYQADVAPAPKKTTPKKGKAGTNNGGESDNGGSELRKERTSTDVLKSFVEFKKVFENATENGNLELDDYKAVLNELKVMAGKVEKMADFEANATGKVIVEDNESKKVA